MSCLLGHAQADPDEDVLPRGVQRLSQADLDGLVALLVEHLEHRRLLELEPDPHGDQDQDRAEEEGQAPQPAVQHGLGGEGDEGESAGAQQGAELDAHEGQRGEEAAALRRRELRDEHGGARLLGPGAQPLEDAEQDQQDRGDDTGGLEGGEDADQEARAAHEGDGGDEDHLAAQLVAEVAEHQPADRPGGEANGVGAQRRDRAAGGAQGLEEQLAEDEGTGQAVDVEVVVLEGRPHRGRQGGAPELLGIYLRLVIGLRHEVALRGEDLP